MTRNSRRGFTLVELIIVIAVIGVLAAILIPVFSNVVDKANIADKTSLARNLNTQLAAEGDGTARVATMGEAMAIAHRQGYTDDQIFNTQTAGTIVFNNATGNFAVVEDVENGTANFAYSDQGMTSAPAGTLMAPVDANEVPAIADQIFGMYLIDSTNVLSGITVNTSVDLDVGDVPVAVVNFENLTSTDTFTFRTNGGQFNVNAPAAVVNHYGFADEVNITAVANASYHEFGVVGVINIENGHLVIENGASVLQGINVIDTSAVTISLFAHAAIVGDESTLQSIITDNTSTNNVEWVATMPEATGFAGGSGTQADPYIIRTAQQFLNIGYTPYEYKYYKVADDVSVINFSGIEISGAGYTSFAGQFDGNGVKFINLNRQLINYGGFCSSDRDAVTVMKNFSVDVNIHTSSNAAAALVYYAYGQMHIEDVTVTGTVEANYPAGMFAYCYYYEDKADGSAWESTFKNCTVKATLINNKASAGCAGFITNVLASYYGQDSRINFINSKFEGEMYRTGDISKYWYFHAQANGTKFHVENSQPIAATQNNGVGTYDFSSQGGTNACVNTFYNAANKTGSIDLSNITATRYEAITVNAVNGATKAVAVLSVGPNDKNGSGNFTGAYLQDEIKVNDGKFTTDNVRVYDITINGNATTRTGISDDGHTFNIVNSNYGTTYGSASITIKLYNDAGTLVAVYTCPVD